MIQVIVVSWDASQAQINCLATARNTAVTTFRDVKDALSHNPISNIEGSIKMGMPLQHKTSIGMLSYLSVGLEDCCLWHMEF